MHRNTEVRCLGTTRDLVKAQHYATYRESKQNRLPFRLKETEKVTRRG